MPHDTLQETNKIRHIAAPTRWHGRCQCPAMQINSTILREISTQVSRGNHTWGLLLANEYLPQESPLRRALVAKAARRGVANSDVPNDLQTSIQAGAKAAQLPDGWQEFIGSRAIIGPCMVPTLRPHRIEEKKRRRCPCRSVRQKRFGLP